MKATVGVCYFYGKRQLRRKLPAQKTLIFRFLFFSEPPELNKKSLSLKHLEIFKVREFFYMAKIFSCSVKHFDDFAKSLQRSDHLF